MLPGRRDRTPDAGRRLSDLRAPALQVARLCTCAPPPAPPPTCFGGRGRGGQNTGRREGRGARPLCAGPAGRAGRASGPLRAAPEEVPGPGGSGLFFLVLRGSDCPCGCGKVLCRCQPRCPQPGPMALVTVSRSPPASGYSTPVGPTVSLALLWSCPRSWLPAGPGGARPAYGQLPLKPGGLRRGTPSLRLEGIRGS